MDEKLKQLIEFIEDRIKDSDTLSFNFYEAGYIEYGNFHEGGNCHLVEVLNKIKELYNI